MCRNPVAFPQREIWGKRPRLKIGEIWRKFDNNVKRTTLHAGAGAEYGSNPGGKTHAPSPRLCHGRRPTHNGPGAQVHHHLGLLSIASNVQYLNISTAFLSPTPRLQSRYRASCKGAGQLRHGENVPNPLELS